MSIYTFLFYFFEGCAGVAALSIVFSRNLFHATLFLLGCLLSVAGLYVLAWAEFVAITQLLIYAGGVLVLILFGIMLTAKMGGRPLVVLHAHEFSGALVGVGFTALMALSLFGNFSHEVTNIERKSPQMESIGVTLMTGYLLPFEIAGILLLVALVGAAVIASHKSKSDVTP
jgi:NADH:ubiquinone oxidoreductase subunit 6 (subunit J)